MERGLSVGVCHSIGRHLPFSNPSQSIFDRKFVLFSNSIYLKLFSFGRPSLFPPYLFPGERRSALLTLMTSSADRTSSAARLLVFPCWPRFYCEVPPIKHAIPVCSDRLPSVLGSVSAPSVIVSSDPSSPQRAGTSKARLQGAA